MFRSMDKVLSENRKLDLEFEMMMASRLNYSEVFPAAAGDHQEGKEAHEEESRLMASASKSSSSQATSQLTKQQWKDLLLHTITRGHSSGYECAICMSEIIPGNRRVVLLSCSHLYHQRCIMNLETFMKTAEVSHAMPSPPVSSLISS